MATTKQNIGLSAPSFSHKQNGAGGIIDDFMYGSNVASAHIYIRMGFMRKVYGILTAQLIVTTLMSGIFMLSDTLQDFVQTNHWMLTISIFATFGILLALMWKRHETPTNYILLGLFTLMESYAIGVVVTFYKVPSVIQAFLLTIGLTVGLTIYTLQSKKDFTSWHAPAVMCLYALVLASLIQVFFPIPALHFGISLIGAALFCVFIVVDTHLLMAKLSPEEYIMAAINLYLDILNLFLYILRLLGERK
ncbi:protein lifeguard 4-like [Biomphalaria glabrata]|uniref:Protein lifeguard 4-like n=2 Tax=Biomphalaria glabrata TaxID=6526 RepID=A0A9U8EIY8_BIOGL|nr:protein lifeguard 4-like [Biomphalaria glabrata]KAI8782128.1 protein lifeguard 4 [Biomphalaria glabrata]